MIRQTRLFSDRDFLTPQSRYTIAALASALLMFSPGCSSDDTGVSSPRATERAAAAGLLVAKVGEAKITRSAYRKLLRDSLEIYATGRGFQGQRYFVFPKLRRCVEDQRQHEFKDKDTPSSVVRATCRRIYRELQDSALTNLIDQEWLRQAAADQGRRLGHNNELPSPERLANRSVRAAGRDVPDSAIVRYYRRHRSYFVQPELRKARAILSPNRAQAMQAKRALQRERSWTTVAREHGLPGTGVEPRTFAGSRDSLDFGLRDLIFQAHKSVLAGPARAQAGWYVTQVYAVTPPRQLSLDESRESIRPVVLQYRREQAAIDYWRAMRLKARAKTVCLTQHQVPACRNGPRAQFKPSGGTAETAVFAHTHPKPALPHPNG